MNAALDSAMIKSMASRKKMRDVLELSEKSARSGKGERFAVEGAKGGFDTVAGEAVVTVVPRSMRCMCRIGSMADIGGARVAVCARVRAS